ncbi:AraC family transcriptional regulator [uncultured Polaribacter sp.]|uniref:helix-turn-helix domain-containing protein n=1 Tax=uncultured Polaribacter sp. TaxID=174711 RepID=UPI0026293369|nr:AraC family transcriptional regulator [uncultured Polaribacter sp.]
MVNTLLIKNMVCNRCTTIVKQLFNNEGIEVQTIQLGKVEIKEDSNIDIIKLEKSLNAQGFELITNSSDVLVERIKIFLIQEIEKGNTNNLFPKLAKNLGKTDSVLSKLFSKYEGVTLEKYCINLKIEKVKEQIELNQLNFSEIAYSLNYKNSSHLAKQFKIVTGMSMTQYKNSQDGNRIPLDKIV